MSNKYKGTCEDCRKLVAANKGTIEKVGRRWIVRCQSCFDKSDHSSYEDRQCGDRAYEDRCAEMCGY